MAEKTKKKAKASAKKAAKAPVKKAAPVKKPAKDLQAVRSVAAKMVAPAAPKKAAKVETKAQPKAKPKKRQSAKDAGPRKLGFGIPLPKSKPEEYDAHCPFFGKTPVHGRILIGTVVSAKMYRTVKVEINRKHYIRKYERYEKRRTRLLVHNPPSINAKVGDNVRIMETRPISKTKHFVVVERISQKVPTATPTEEQKG